MNAKKVKTFKQLQDYIEGCLNDYENDRNTKTETIYKEKIWRINLYGTIKNLLLYTLAVSNITSRL